MPETAGCSRPPATVIVCNHDRPQLLPRCLQHIAADLKPGDQLVVVQSGAARVAPDLPGLPPGITPRFWPSADRRKAANLNAVIDAGTDEAVLLTDDDCLVPRGWVEAMTLAVLHDPRTVAAFGPVRGLSSLTGAPREYPKSGPAPIENWNFAHGASMAVRRTAMASVGGFDERFGPGSEIGGGEEADLLLRLSALGWSSVIAEAPAVEHLSWRDPAEEHDNVLLYQRAAGAWVGAAVRRSPRQSAKVAALRLRHEADYWRHPGTQGWGLASSLSRAFLSGLRTGLTIAPKRRARDER